MMSLTVYLFCYKGLYFVEKFVKSERLRKIIYSACLFGLLHAISNSGERIVEII